MTKLSLNPPATFRHQVEIPIAGTKPARVEFEFKYRDRDELRAWINEQHGDEEAVLSAVVGWVLDDEFSPDNVRRLCRSYPGAAFAIVDTYVRQLQGR